MPGGDFLLTLHPHCCNLNLVREHSPTYTMPIRQHCSYIEPTPPPTTIVTTRKVCFPLPGITWEAQGFYRDLPNVAGDVCLLTPKEIDAAMHHGDLGRVGFASTKAVRRLFTFTSSEGGKVLTSAHQETRRPEVLRAIRVILEHLYMIPATHAGWR